MAVHDWMVYFFSTRDGGQRISLQVNADGESGGLDLKRRRRLVSDEPSPVDGMPVAYLRRN